MKYPGVRYREDGEPLNDIERMLHNDKAEADSIRQSLVEMKDMIREMKLELQAMRRR